MNIAKIVCLIFIAMGFLPAFCFADMDSTVPTTPTIQPGGSSGGGHSRGGTKNLKLHKQSGTGNRKGIRGHCSLVASASNPIAGACTGINLVLLTAEGKEITRARCSSNGDFEFAVDPNSEDIPQRITAASHAYELAAPIRPFAKGEPIELVLRQK